MAKSKTGSTNAINKATNQTATGTDSKTSAKKTAAATSAFREFFTDELKDIYWAEQHLANALPKMQEAATSAELAAAFKKHAEETNLHIQTLENVFLLLDEKPAAKKCDAMAGLIKEAQGIIEDTDAGTMIRDAGLILAAQKVEHYEIATYGTLVVFAKQMGNSKIAEQLQFTLDNEKATDVALTEVAIKFINDQAAEE